MKWLKIFIILLVATASLFILWKFILPLFKSPNSFLKITTPTVESTVYLDSKQVGKTPYIGEKLPSGDYNLQFNARLPDPFNKKVSFSTLVTLTSRTLTAVNYEFGPSEQFSSGDIRTFRSGEGLSIITNPNGADVWLDGELIGKSPLSSNAGLGVHKLKISAWGFITRELEINIENGYRLVVEVYLAQNPFGEVKQTEEGKLDLYDLSTSQESLLTKPSLWAEGIFFFEESVKIEFDALIDTGGKTHFKSESAWEEKIAKGNQVVVGYLGNEKDKGLTPDAKKTLAVLKKQLVTTKKVAIKQVQILSTPTGSLNVRSGPGTSYDITAKVHPGEKYELLEEKPDWYKIKLSSGSGWISSQYAKRL